MAKTKTWKTLCRKCQSPVYYYPAKLLLESHSESQEDVTKRIVDCTCAGETESGKHTLSYNFPENFNKVDL